LIRGALKRLAILVAVVVGVTASASLVLGALDHANLLRSLALGFYIAGVAVLLGSFLLGLRGPMRPDYGEEDRDETGMPGGAHTIRGGGMMGGIGGLMPRSIRRTTAEERGESRRNSLALFALGLALVLVGAGFDPTRRPF
jgi:hypothetical protein